MKKPKDDFRKQKDIKILRCFIYQAYGGPTLHIQVMDRLTGKIYAGNIGKTYDKLKDWEKHHK